MAWLIWLWPISGWYCAYASTPKWMFERDPFGYAVLAFCGAVVGPFGILWLIFDNTRPTEPKPKHSILGFFKWLISPGA